MQRSVWFKINGGVATIDQYFEWFPPWPSLYLKE